MTGPLWRSCQRIVFFMGRAAVLRASQVFGFIGANRDMSWPILDQILVSALNFVIGIAIARALGTAEFGRITLILLLAAQAGVFQEYVLSAPMMTLIGRRARRTPHYFGAILTWGVLSSLLGAVAVALAIAV